MRPSAHRSLRRTLAAGALYDLALGVFILVAGSRTLEVLGYGAPGDPYLFRLSTLPLFVLPALYAAAARAHDLRPWRWPVLWARGGGGCLIAVLTLQLSPAAAPAYYGVAVLDLSWAVLHALLWRRSSR